MFISRYFGIGSYSFYCLRIKLIILIKFTLIKLKTYSLHYFVIYVIQKTNSCIDSFTFYLYRYHLFLYRFNFPSKILIFATLINKLKKWYSVTLHSEYYKRYIGLQSMRVKYKEENSSLCQNCSDVSLAMRFAKIIRLY